MDNNVNFKVKLIFPCIFEDFGKENYKYPPYGMGILVTFLKKNNYHIVQEDLRINSSLHKKFFYPTLISKHIFIQEFFKQKFDEINGILETGDFKCGFGLIIDKLLEPVSLDGFDLIGFSINTYQHLVFALLFSLRIKQAVGKPIVFGGPFITLFGHLYPKIFDYIDYLIVGDGRMPLIKLIDHLNNKIPISEVPNLVYKEDGQLKANPKISYPLEEVPLPDFAGLPLGLYINQPEKGSIRLPYQISRGCTGRCSFCVYTCLNNGKLEFKSYSKVISELRAMREKYNSKIFDFHDDAINNSYEYLEGLCDIFIKNKIGLYWGAFAKVGNLDESILKKMKKAGCFWLSFGIESGSNTVLKKMNKGFTVEKASQTLKYASEAGIKNVINLMVGFPGETEEDIKKTTDFIQGNKKYIVYFHKWIFALVYGSSIHLNPQAYGVTNLNPNPYYNFIFNFDECDGLKWKQKLKQQENSLWKLIKTVNKWEAYKSLAFYYCWRLYLLFKKYTLGF